MRAKILWFVFLLLIAPAICVADCPPLPEAPAVSGQEFSFQAKWQWFAEPYSGYDWPGQRDYAPLGIGHLKIAPASNAWYDGPKK